MSKRIKRKELINELSEELGIPKQQAGQFYDAFSRIIATHLMAGDEVLLMNFLKLAVLDTKESRRVLNGRVVKVPAKKKVKVTLMEAFLSELNNLTPEDEMRKLLRIMQQEREE